MRKALGAIPSETSQIFGFLEYQRKICRNLQISISARKTRFPEISKSQFKIRFLSRKSRTNLKSTMARSCAYLPACLPGPPVCLLVCPCFCFFLLPACPDQQLLKARSPRRNSGFLRLLAAQNGPKYRYAHKLAICNFEISNPFWARGAVASHPPCMRKALGPLHSAPIAASRPCASTSFWPPLPRSWPCLFVAF